MRTVYIVGGEDDLGPPPSSPKKRSPRGSVRYTIKCSGLTDDECSALARELGRHFPLVPTVRKNPAVPWPDWHKVLLVALLVGNAAVPRLLNVLESIVKEWLAKGRKAKTIVLYGPDGKVVKRLRKPTSP